MAAKSLAYSFYVAFLATVFSFSHEVIKNGYEIYSTDTFILIFSTIFIQYALYYLCREKKWQSKIYLLFYAFALLLAGLCIYLLPQYTYNAYNVTCIGIGMLLPILYFLFYNKKQNAFNYLKPLLLSLNWVNYTIILPLAMENRLSQLDIGYAFFSLAFIYTICVTWEFRNIISSNAYAGGIVGVTLSFFTTVVLFLATLNNYINNLLCVLLFILMAINIGWCIKKRNQAIWFILLDAFMLLWTIMLVVDFVA